MYTKILHDTNTVCKWVREYRLKQKEKELIEERENVEILKKLDKESQALSELIIFRNYG